MKRSKRYQLISLKVNKAKTYSLDEAIDLLKETSNAKFVEAVDIAVKLGIDPKRTDQMVKGSVNLPYGTGKEIKVLVLTRGEKEKEAKEAQADYVGLEEYVEKIKQGWTDFDAVVATPDVMPEVGKLGKILGPKGLMPSPKTGTVTFDVATAVKSLKAGKIQYKTDKTGNIHARIGRVDFEKEKLKKNIIAFISELLKEKPAGVKGQYLKSVTISSTMGPGIKLDVKELQELARKEL
ncbi:MAG: 50S ribosomal protein L1 [candidate division WOR-3 bacterium]|uniref:Large ribosomal subunit protein uL1 n=1 Tax=candidate division WOR-3 bacterium TaxID=2052148 RepID=A0A7V4FGC7_UNCW3